MILSCERISALVTKVQNDFLDVPGLTLTLPKAQKRFGTDALTCEAVLGALVDARVLTRTSDGDYVRFFPRHSARPRFAAWRSETPVLSDSMDEAAIPSSEVNNLRQAPCR